MSASLAALISIHSLTIAFYLCYRCILLGRLVTLLVSHDML